MYNIYFAGEKIIVAIDKTSVKMLDTEPLLKYFTFIGSQPEEYVGSIMIGFGGYDNDIRAVYEIPEIREFYANLYNDFPALLLFLSREEFEGNSAFEIFFLMLTELDIAKEKIGGALYRIDKEQSILHVSTSLRAIGKLLEDVDISIDEKVKMVKDIEKAFKVVFSDK
ncbi:hypothetical protein [Olivibacter domesticus]|uniref:Uncharacterized protein n=1 Tax=Olivibacter domesticus TaxID=407022 RepID=A0A1H7ICF8_OLID1|nr:hypothetical protein [Olivibacter domesticus]SEK58295.1 hypothetical protein SAMN05661044_00606 [Olivibacter domesticus]